MKQLTWEEYYDGFYDWVPSTQKSYAYRLSDYGSADEVWEIAEELDFEDSAFAAKFLERAFSAGVRFTPEQVLEMEGTVERSFLSRLAEQSDGDFSLEELEDMSGAKVGDKTMMDALIPASEAVAAYTGDSADELFDAAAQAAAQGAEATKQYVSKFGRAKSYGTKTIGTPDAGAVSMSWFFQGLARE